MNRAAESDLRRGDPLAGTRPTLAAIHRHQVHREPWPDFAAFDPSGYPLALREDAARQWMSRAQQELGSVYEFTALAHALAACRAPIELLGGLSRLITDEVRHAELCGRLARAIWPEAGDDDGAPLAWQSPRMPFAESPPLGPGPDGAMPILLWAADAILCSCCIGETMSLPLFEAAATVCTDDVCESVVQQILRDEHLHAAFGWEALAELWAHLDGPSRGALQGHLARRLGGFEQTSSAGVDLAELVNTAVIISPGNAADPNLGILSPHQHAMIFYAVIETEILAGFDAIGLDAPRAWAERTRYP